VLQVVLPRAADPDRVHGGWHCSCDSRGFISAWRPALAASLGGTLWPGLAESVPGHRWSLVRRFLETKYFTVHAPSLIASSRKRPSPVSHRTPQPGSDGG